MSSISDGGRRLVNVAVILVLGLVYVAGLSLLTAGSLLQNRVGLSGTQTRSSERAVEEEGHPAQ